MVHEIGLFHVILKRSFEVFLWTRLKILLYFYLFMIFATVNSVAKLTSLKVSVPADEKKKKKFQRRRTHDTHSFVWFSGIFVRSKP